MKDFQFNFIQEWTNKFFDWSSKLPVSLSIEVSHALACQSALETGYGTSEIFKVNHNLFGMKLPRVRYNLAVCERNNHSCYDGYYQSFCDMVIWLLYNKFPQGCFLKVDEYLTRLQASMFNPSKFYTSKIRDIMNSYYKFLSLKPKDHEKEDSIGENVEFPF